jgi:hypothetical protein
MCEPCPQIGEDCYSLLGGAVVKDCCPGTLCIGGFVDPQNYFGTCACASEGDACEPGFFDCCDGRGLTCAVLGSGKCEATG